MKRQQTGLVWFILPGLITYQAVLYGGIMHSVLGVTVALLPWLLNQPHYRIYDNVIVQYSPGKLWFDARLYQIIPDPLLRARILMIALVAISTCLVFWIAARWWGNRFGLFAAVLYAAWGPVMMDHLAYFDVVMGVLALSILATCVQDARAVWRPITAGLLAGLAVLVKQQALMVIIVYIVWTVLSRQGRLVYLLAFTVSAAVPLLVAGITFVMTGTFSSMIYWVWTFNLGPYAELAPQAGLPLKEYAVLFLWLAPTGLYVGHILTHRRLWGRHEGLLLGLLIGMSTPAFPRYARFHLAGAVPMVALAAAGGLWLLSDTRSLPSIKHKFLSAILAGVATISLVVALILPWHYAHKLGSVAEEYQPLFPLVQLLRGNGVEAGTRIWVLPEIDPIGNTYVIGGYLPPVFWCPNYPWFYSAPHVAERMLSSLENNPPDYAVLILKWRDQVPGSLLAFLERNYTPFVRAEMANGLGQVVVYRRLALRPQMGDSGKDVQADMGGTETSADLTRVPNTL